MAQLINLNQNNSFVNRMQSPLLYEKSGAILLVLVGLTAGWQSDQILVGSITFIILYTDHREFNEGTLLS